MTDSKSNPSGINDNEEFKIVKTEHYRVNRDTYLQIGSILAYSGRGGQARKLGKGVPSIEMLQRYSRTYSELKTFTPYNFGGFTRVTIVDPNGTEFEGTSTCSMEDQFNYKVGRRNAIKDAVMNMRSATAEVQDAIAMLEGYGFNVTVS